MTGKMKLVANTTKSRTTKKAQLIKLLSVKAGADIATISGKLGWQTHTTRAAITGLRKAGYEITAEKTDGGKPTRYRIIAEPPPAEGDAQSAAAPEETVDAG